jgi:uncharacterized cupin superfamily protein
MSDKNHAARDASEITEVTGIGYPAPFRDVGKGRHRRALGDAFGLSQFGVGLVRLEPGAWSSQRHWHTNEDELVYVLQGELTLLTDAGEQIM